MKKKSSQQNILYCDCFSGISGDMFIGALLHAGLPFELLQENIRLLGIDDYTLHCRKNTTYPIAATDFSVQSTTDTSPHRNLSAIHAIIHNSQLKDPVKLLASDIFTTLAGAEAAVHGTSIEDVHFHEVGAVDAIIDITGAAIGLDYFSIESCSCSPLPVSSGWVDCDHGKLPLPAPAVAEMTKNIPVYGVNHTTELVTPTGAAIVKTIAKSFGPMPHITPSHVGYGSGKSSLPDDQPNLLRVIIGQSSHCNEFQEVVITETNLDDWPAERISFLMDKLFSLGALDVSITPIQMKKNRPGFTVQVISSQADSYELQRCLLIQTSAIGVRFRKEQRWTLPRENGVASTRWGDIRVKRIHSPDGPRTTPEFEDCQRVANQHNIPIDRVYNEVLLQSFDSFNKVE